MIQSQINQVYDFAKKLTIRVGKHIEDSKSRIEIVQQKDIGDMCTNIDKEAEQIFIDAITQNYPTHNVISEEIGEIDNKGEFSWIIDPIDGTKDYVRDLPVYRTAIALENNNQTLISCSYYPYLDTLYSSAIGHKAFKNEKQICVGGQSNLAKTILYAYIPNNKLPSDKNEHIWKVLQNLQKSCYRL